MTTFQSVTAAELAELDGFHAVGPDGTPMSETPADTADRVSRLADELAGVVNQVGAALSWQAEALRTVAATTPMGQSHLSAARTLAARSATALLEVVLAGLGDVHVTCDQLAHDLHAAAAP